MLACVWYTELTCIPYWASRTEFNGHCGLGPRLLCVCVCVWRETSRITAYLPKYYCFVLTSCKVLIFIENYVIG